MSSPTPYTRWQRVTPIGLAVAAFVSLVVLAFVWPAATSGVHGVPITVAGPDAQVSQVERAVEASGGTFDVRSSADRAAAVRLIRERDVYGAVVLGDGAPEVLKATAANPAAAQVMNSLAAILQGQLPAGSPEVSVTDVVPLSADDPTGSGLAAAAFPLVLGGMLGGIFLSLLVHGPLRRLAALLVTSVAGGLALPAVLQLWLGVLQGGYWHDAAACTLAISGIAATILGAVCLVGRLGVAVGPVVFLLFANPISSATAPPEFLPGPWGDVGQWFPPGAGAHLIRNLSYFPDASSAFSWSVLAGWTALGVLLIVGTAVRRAEPHPPHGQHVALPQEDPLTV